MCAVRALLGIDQRQIVEIGSTAYHSAHGEHAVVIEARLREQTRLTARDGIVA
jgi:hypothetical protein